MAKDTFQISPRTQGILRLIFDFVNAPLLGAIIGAILGLIPPLHEAFFNSSQSTDAASGIFTAWLTSSLRNVGSLFASLQIVAVGVSLASSLRKAKRGEDSGPVPWVPSIFVLFVRFIVWPILSVAITWTLAIKTSLLGSDPMLWFALMLMLTGPPAMKLVAMADVNGADEKEKLSIAKFLTVGCSCHLGIYHVLIQCFQISYAISPLICFAAVASLKASEMAIRGLHLIRRLSLRCRCVI